MADEVARLVAVMEAQLRGFTKGMEQAQRIADQRFGAIERRMSRTERFFGAGFAGIGRNLTRFLSVAAVTAFTRSMINTADQLKDTAEQIGITTQQLQEFQFAARTTGGSADAIAGSLKILNDRLGDAANGEGELAEIMRELNIPMGTATQVLNDLADATQRAGTQAERARIATAAFGRAGSANISFLAQGAAGLRDMADEAHRLNQVWDDATIDRLDRMKEAFSGLGASITNLLAEPVSIVLEGWRIALDGLARSLGIIEQKPDLSRIRQMRQELADLDAQISQTPVGPLGSNLRTQRSALNARIGADMEAILRQQLPLDFSTDRKPTPPKPSGGGSSDPERQLLDFLGLPDLPSGEAFMERYWQVMADKAAAAQGAAAAESRFDPRAITPVPTPTEGPVDISDIIGFGGPEIQELTEEFDFFTESAKDGLVDVGLAAVRGFDDAKEAAGRLLERLGDMILEFGVLRPLIEMMFGGTGGSGGFFGSLFQGFFAQGGTIPKGRWGVVGENGPELAFSGPGGTRILSNAQMPSMATPMAGGNRASVIVNQNFSLDGAVGEQGMRAAMRQEAAAAAAGTFRAVRSALPGMMVEAHKRVL